MKILRGLMWAGLTTCFISCNDAGSEENTFQRTNSESEQSKSTSDKNIFAINTKLPKELKESSGIVAYDGAIWAITDERVPFMYKLDENGNLLQTIEISGVKMKDVEAIAADAEYFYVGDIGDNDGDRENRFIYKIAKSSIGNGKNEKVKAEVIEFSFKNFEELKKKKNNEYDAEAMISMGDQLYIFTKRRTDDKTELLSVSKKAGKHVANSIATYNSKGMITGAGINKEENEIALIGYSDGHTNSFIILLNNFSASDVFNGNQQRFELSDSKLDWQTEGISFWDNDVIYFSCETTSDVPATLYALQKSNLDQVKKQKIN